MEKYYKKNSIISAILIFSFVVSPVALLPKKAEATNINGYVGGLSGVITQLPLCQNKLVDLFSGGGKVDVSNIAFSAPETADIYGSLGEEEATLYGKSEAALSQVESIPVVLPDGVTKDISIIKKGNEEIKQSTSSLSSNDTCLKSIGRAVIKMLLQKITVSTVNWINSGYNGSPMFIQDPGQFFNDIAKNEILQFGIEINDSNSYPYGKNFMQGVANNFNSTFATNAKYSLDKLIQDTTPEYSAQTFSVDFSQGGWGAWDAMTQYPQNNPLGFNLMASDELQRRLQGTSQSNAENLRDSLNQSNGYLGLKKCTDPEGVSEEENIKAIKERSGKASSFTGPFQYRLCNTWENVTPGQMVAEAATKAINYPDNNLLQAQDLNDAVAAILDALLNNFTSNLTSDSGFAGLSDTYEFQQGADGSFVIDSDNTTTRTNPRQDFSDYVLESSSFLNQNPNFNIRTDLSQALIDEHRIFISKLEQQNKELNSTTDGKKYALDPTTGVSNAYGLVPTIYQLDYCIPGPHPGFEDDSRRALNAALATIVPETISTIKNKTTEDIVGMIQTVTPLAVAAVGAVVGASVSSVVPVIGTAVGTIVGAIVGIIIGYIVKWIGSSADKKIRSYYAGQIGLITGIKIMIDTYNHDSATLDKGPMVDAMNKILDRYIIAIQNIFTPDVMPTATKEAKQKYNEALGYNQMQKNNEEKIVKMQSVITRLTEIKKQIDKLNQELKDSQIKNADGDIAPPEDTTDSNGNTVLGQQSQYEENLKPWIASFGRISADMVTGDSIAVIDNTTKQIVDEKDYIYKDLLKGFNGCEKDLELNRQRLFGQIHETKRMEYPGPILYDYNVLQADTLDAGKNGIEHNPKALIPDPVNNPIKYKNYMNSMAKGTLGPGFLSVVNFENSNTYCSDYFTDSTCHESDFSRDKLKDPGILYPMIRVNDLFPLRDWTTAVGIYNLDPNNVVSGVFESMIGVY